MIRGCIEGLLPQKLKIGLFANIPFLSVNAFSKDKYSDPSELSQNRAFFLTHCDDEIMKDVLNLEYLQVLLSEAPLNSRILYMHKLCYNYLIYWLTTSTTAKIKLTQHDAIYRLLQQLRKKSKIVFLEENTRIRLIFENKTKQHDYYVVDVTPISAGHNAGSVMLLIEPRPQGEGEGDQPEQRILYTGNCRVSLQDLRNCQPLYHKCGVLKRISELYIDTTFCMSHVKELPSRRKVETELIEFIAAELYFNSQSNIRFEIWTPFVLETFGLEYLNSSVDISSLHFLRSIHLKFDQPIHVPLNLSLLLEELPNCKNWTTSTNGHEYLFHYYCGYLDNNSHCSEFDYKEEFDVNHICLQCDMFRTPVSPTEDETEWNEHGTCVYVKKPDVFRGIYSSHLSRYEIGRMINFLKVDLKRVFPIYRPKFMTTENVKNLLAKTCEEINKTVTVEPDEIANEYSSHLYDFNTKESLPPREFYRRIPIAYYFDIGVDLDQSENNSSRPNSGLHEELIDWSRHCSATGMPCASKIGGSAIASSVNYRPFTAP